MTGDIEEDFFTTAAGNESVSDVCVGSATQSGRMQGDSIRMFVHKRGRVIDLVVDHEEKILLGVVGGDILESIFLRHVEGGVMDVGSM